MHIFCFHRLNKIQSPSLFDDCWINETIISLLLSNKMVKLITVRCQCLFRPVSSLMQNYFRWVGRLLSIVHQSSTHHLAWNQKGWEKLGYLHYNDLNVLVFADIHWDLFFSLISRLEFSFLWLRFLEPFTHFLQ